jgi:iron complex outermembrane recepter protein
VHTLPAFATSSYTLLNAELSYTMKGVTADGITPVTTIGIRGENLLDEDVRNSASSRRTRCCCRERA